jgi:hypothetical protein
LSLVVPLLYLFANILASAWTAIKKPRHAQESPLPNLHSLLFLPLIFAILHLSYGLGFLAGLFRFWNRWGDRTGQTPAWQGERSG